MTANFELVQFSVVVLGKVHNPSILNPDFLAIQEIVPKGWEWEIEGSPITTPPMAVVRYTNGVSITVDPNRLQLSDLQAGDNPLESKIVEMARRYIETLKHIRYSAVGLNFHGVLGIPDPESYLKNRFLKAGPWDAPVRPLEAAGFRLVYLLPEGRLVFSIDSGEASVGQAFSLPINQQPGEAAPQGKDREHAIIVSANFHRECDGYPAYDQAVAHLGHVADDCSMYNAILKDVFESEG